MCKSETADNQIVAELQSLRSVQMPNDSNQTPDLVQIQVNRIIFLLERVATLHEAIAHGSPEHRDWLKQAIDDHFAGRPVEAPRG